jgi:hypothetical protein
MPTITSDSIGKTVSFNTHATSVLGTNFNRVKVLGILDHESAMQYINVPIISVNVYPSLPVGTSKDFQNYQFLKIKHTNGDNGCVAIEWIDNSTYVTHEGVNIEFRVEDANASDADRIREILAFNGFAAVNFNLS